MLRPDVVVTHGARFVARPGDARTRAIGVVHEELLVGRPGRRRAVDEALLRALLRHPERSADLRPRAPGLTGRFHEVPEQQVGLARDLPRHLRCDGYTRQRVLVGGAVVNRLNELVEQRGRRHRGQPYVDGSGWSTPH